jgi:cytoskeletal protein CcmA (bactofilin family)
MFAFDRLPLAWALALLALLPLGIEGQLRTVISNEIAVSEREASLRLHFQDDVSFAIVFSEGSILVDGEPRGTYTRRDPLDLAWRSLLGEVVALDNGPLAEALVAWSPPQELTGEAAELGRLLDQAMEGALALTVVPSDTPIHMAVPGEEGLLGALLRRTTALGALAEALEGVEVEQATVRVGQDLVVQAGEELEATVIVVDGNLVVRGTIRGDVVVTDGKVSLPEGGRITGNLRLANGELERAGGTVEGSVRLLEAGEEPRLDRHEVDDLRRSLEREIRRDVLAGLERDRRRSTNPVLGAFRNVGRAIADLLENTLTLVVLAIFGALTLHFARDRLEVVATTARSAPARSAMVGLAGGFLLIPAFVLGIVALAVTIVGIPFILVWVPLFPLAAALAGLLGYLAVARNVGEWVAEQEYRGLEWIRGSNAFYTLTAGIAALMVPCIASSALRVLGLGFLTGLLAFVGSVVVFLAVAVGFGAVLLTRGGRIRPYEAYEDFEEDFWTGSRTAGGDEDFSTATRNDWTGAAAEEESAGAAPNAKSPGAGAANESARQAAKEKSPGAADNEESAGAEPGEKRSRPDPGEDSHG